MRTDEVNPTTDPTWHQVRVALRTCAPIAAALIPLGVALGVFVVIGGINWYWAPLSALMIFAGSSEYAGVGFIVAGTPIPQVAVAALAINFRHIFYGLTFPYRRFKSLGQKIYGIFALIDEVYAVTSAGEGARLNGFQITVLQVACQASWVGGALIGALVGQIVPPSLRGIEFALTAMFAVLAVDAFRARREFRLVYLAVGAVVAGYLADTYVYPESFLVVGLMTYWAAMTYLYAVRGERPLAPV